MTVLPPEVQSLLNASRAQEEELPKADVSPPVPNTFMLDGGYLDIDGTLIREFKVRELTGRDEEALGKITSGAAVLLEILNRGLVSVGPYKGRDAQDGILAGDWETVLLAIRAVTFGREVVRNVICSSCKDSYEVPVDLLEDIPHRELDSVSDIAFKYTGKHGTIYEVALPTGVTQRSLLRTAVDKSAAEQNTVVLTGSVKSIGRNPLVTTEDILNMPIADRMGILKELLSRRPGPDMEGVKSLCPTCGAENPVTISIAAVFL